ncbi:MAG: isopentenyl-diphosphate Delta-isomerase [Bacteroidetes bacterium]|nr:isopentenyl-diphosphate Delta-isomerase [Bacteroidota bacterium]
MDKNLVVLVNELDQDLGLMEKLEVHQKGLLHRAFSVLIFNSNNELLLQRRGFGKYHSEGLWSNTCCSHPNPGESIQDAGRRRLIEEMGMDVELKEAFQFIYKARLDKHLTEFELDHVLIGYSDNTPHLNLEEVSAFAWKSIEAIKKDMDVNPTHYTKWFKILLTDHFDQIKTHL